MKINLLQGGRLPTCLIIALYTCTDSFTLWLTIKYP